MQDRFESCAVFSQKEEGGYVADPRDSGNWSSGQVGQGRLIGSNMGVGAPALIAWLGVDCKVDAELMRNLPVATSRAIARQKYWQPLRCDLAPAGLDLMMFDFGWNRGLQAARSVLHRSLGIDLEAQFAPPVSRSTEWVKLLLPADVVIVQREYALAEDGIVGPKTLQAIGAKPTSTVLIGILVLCRAQMQSYRALNDFPIYGEGWIGRTERRRDEARHMAALATVRSDSAAPEPASSNAERLASA